MPRNRPKYRFYAREFLNRRGHHGGAYILAVVDRTEPTDDPDRYVNIELEIADCSRHITLEFPVWSAGDRSNTVRKARLLANVLDKFADAVETETVAASERAKQRPNSAHGDDLLGPITG